MYDAGYPVQEMANLTSGHPNLDPPLQSAAEIRSGRSASAKRGPVGGALKRYFDIAAALVAILSLAPLLLLVSALIRIYDRGPILFRHRRVGYNGSVFYCLKFRTMVQNSESVLSHHLNANPQAASEWASSQKLKNDPRVTVLGVILRRTSLDELPQIFNILRGEMSFVGPRPIVNSEIPKYDAAIQCYFRARPGLTGKWQVSGRNDLSYATRVALDRQYIENWSFLDDLKILIRTVSVVVRARGCY